MICNALVRTLVVASAFGLIGSIVPSRVRAGGLTTIVSFNGADGIGTFGGVTFDASGNLYGTTIGSTTSDGTVWEINAGGNTVNTLATFDGTNGGFPSAGVTFDAGGNLYGTTYNGGTHNLGTVWELAAGANTISSLGSFSGTTGSNPYSGVTLDANGNLYGTANLNGAHGVGSVWEVKAGTTGITTVAPFNVTNGAAPYSSVTIDSQGNIFGTTNSGGDHGSGTVWEIKVGTTTIIPLASFQYGPTGNPTGAVTIDSHGNIFGTTQQGGPSGVGAIWELANGSSTIQILASFNSATGGYPQAGVTLDSHGDLFGTAEFGGTNNAGMVWELANGSSTISVIGAFDGSNGANPWAGVTIGPDGNLYGTTTNGGANDDGTVWTITLNAVPEPSTLVLGLIGMASVGGIVMVKRRRR